MFSSKLKLESMLRASKALNPVMARDHHAMDKISMVSSGNCPNLVVFKDQKKAGGEHVSSRQSFLKGLHDQQNEDTKQAQEKRFKMVKKFNKSLI